jgi:hypothetical protein
MTHEHDWSPLEEITKEEWDAILGVHVWPDLDDWRAWDILTDTLRAYAAGVEDDQRLHNE